MPLQYKKQSACPVLSFWYQTSAAESQRVHGEKAVQFRLQSFHSKRKREWEQTAVKVFAAWFLPCTHLGSLII